MGFIKGGLLGELMKMKQANELHNHYMKMDANTSNYQCFYCRRKERTAGLPSNTHCSKSPTGYHDWYRL